MREVGEDGDIEPQGVEPVKNETVGGGFQDHGGHAFGLESPQGQALHECADQFFLVIHDQNT